MSTTHLPSSAEVTEFLLTTELDLAADAASALAHELRPVCLEAGEFLFLRGSATDRFFVVFEGTLEIQVSSFDGKELVFTIKGRGDTIGEAAIIDASPRTASVRATSNATLLAIGRERFLALAEAHASLAMALARAAAVSLRRESSRIEERAFAPLAPRLAGYLLAESRNSAQREVQVTQQSLADRMGVTRETVNKTLRLWEVEGLVELGRGRIVLVRPDGLESRRL